MLQRVFKIDYLSGRVAFAPIDGHTIASVKTALKEYTYAEEQYVQGADKLYQEIVQRGGFWENLTTWIPFYAIIRVERLIQ